MAGNKRKEALLKDIAALKEGAGKIAHDISQPLQVISMVLSQIEHGVVKIENIHRGQRMIEKIVELSGELKNLAAGEEDISVKSVAGIPADAETIEKTVKSFRILVVDDNVDIVDMMIENFRLIGYQCDGTADGETAIPLVEKNKYDLIISDLLMPRMSGKQVFEAVKNLNYDGKFLFLTGYIVSQELRKVVDQADGILYKPFQLEELFELVKKTLHDQ